jgi:tripartite-type tricarboxylate transporter receptor subunit TctC
LASAEPDRLLVGKDAKTFTEYGVKNAFFNTKWMFSAPKGLAPNIVKAFSDALEEATKDKKLIGLITNKLNLRLEFTPADKLLKIIEQKQINGKARIKLVR